MKHTSQSENFESGKEFGGLVEATFDVECDHAAESLHLLHGQLVLRVALQSRMNHFQNADSEKGKKRIIL